MHIELAEINVDQVINDEPIQPSRRSQSYLLLMTVVGFFAFLLGVFAPEAPYVWGAFYVNVIFFMGLAAGSVMISVIFQIVRAEWSGPLRRFSEANIAFLPWAYVLLLSTYFGRKYLFPWGAGEMPGREWWMQAEFVYIRFALLFLLLFFLMWRFVALSLRNDIGFIRERLPKKAFWRANWFYDSLTKEWRGSHEEVVLNNRTLSVRAPVLVFLYAVVFTLFSTEMITGMDKKYVSNLFGAFIFMGNIFMGWAALSLSSIFHAKRNKTLDSILTSQQLWDLGKLTFGFCMIWGYFFFSQFLPQWYGNLPEETQWLILRTREFPWKGWGWMTFAMCFIFPFVVLLGRDVKKNPVTLSIVSLVIFFGVWAERYLLVMPQLSPDAIPFGIYEILIFLGFLGLYLLTVRSFLSQFPCIAISHPLTHGSSRW